jgi:isorenieratene synthase
VNALYAAPFALLATWCGWRLARRAPSWLRSWLAGVIRRRFGGYVHTLEAVDHSLPLSADAACERRVAVIGAGLAGMGVACDLAERGLRVKLFEKNEYLGGKVGAWQERAPDGGALEVEHGFHAFFRHYYNLNAFLDRTGVRQHLAPVSDYLILAADGARFSFGDVETVPVLNLLALARAGLYRLREILFTPALHEMDVFLAYERDPIFAELDQVSYEAFARRAQLPRRLRLVFNTFARSFFAEGDRLSMAELVKSFHFYYLSHDHGLLYDYLAGDYRRTLLDPIQAYMEQRGVEIALGRGCGAITPLPEGGYLVDQERFDYAVLATSSAGARALVEGSPELQLAAPRLAACVRAQSPGQRYAVWRLWIDRDVRADLPVFVSTERLGILDAVALCHRVGRAACAARDLPAAAAVLELHSYALPDALDEAAVRETFVRELLHYFPELVGFQVQHEVLQVRADFTAFHVGMDALRPETHTELPGLYLAGDWVRLPCPAMLMEAALTSSLLATNAILRAEGLRTYPVLSVPPRGLLAGVRREKRRRT